MAVTSVKLSWRDRRNSISADGVKAQLVYTATTDDPADGADVVRNDSRVPHLGQPHPRDALLACVSVDPQCEGPMYWEVTCQYEKPESAGKEGGGPVAEPPIIDWSTVESEEPADMDEDGVPILNPNGEPFDPPPSKTYNDEVLRVTRHEGSYSPLETRRYLGRGGSVNSDAFQHAKPGECRMTKRDGKAVQLGTLLVWQVEYEFRFRRPAKDQHPSTTWHWKILCQGNWWWSGDLDRNKQKIPGDKDSDSQGREIERTYLLNANGTRLLNERLPVWLYFRKYPALPFRRWQFPAQLWGEARV